MRDHMGKAYSWKQPLDDGHQPWALRPLVGHVARNDQSHECHLAPASLRPIFIRVLLDCLVEVGVEMSLAAVLCCMSLKRQTRFLRFHSSVVVGHSQPVVLRLRRHAHLFAKVRDCH